jgi:hypothetical protein
MGGTEKRRRGFVAEYRRFCDCFNQVDTATGSIFFLLAILGLAKAWAATSPLWVLLER